MYFQPISSDILSGANGSASVIAACKTNYINMVTRGRALYPNARHIITNLGPRQEFTGDGTTADTYEYARLQCNTWLALLPLGSRYLHRHGLTADRLGQPCAGPSSAHRRRHAHDTASTPDRSIAHPGDPRMTRCVVCVVGGALLGVLTVGVVGVALIEFTEIGERDFRR